MSGDFFLRQQLRFEHAAGAGAIEAVVQKLCDELTVVGLAPFGGRAFTLTQRGRDVAIEMHQPGAWPFPPENVLRDVHRVFGVPLPERPPGGGERELAYGGERVRERWVDGRLRERVISPAAGRGVVVVTYLDGARRGEPPREVRLVDRAAGYALEVTTLEHRALSCEGA